LRVCNLATSSYLRKLGTGKATDFKFGGYIYRANPNKSPGVSRECPNFGGTPIISGTGKAMDFKFCGYIYRANPNKSPLKFLRKGSVAYPGTAQFFGYSILSQERVKLRTSNFEGTFTGWIGTKAHEKCWE